MSPKAAPDYSGITAAARRISLNERNTMVDTFEPDYPGQTAQEKRIDTAVAAGLAVADSPDDEALMAEFVGARDKLQAEDEPYFTANLQNSLQHRSLTKAQEELQSQRDLFDLG